MAAGNKISLFVLSDLHAFYPGPKDTANPSELKVTAGKKLSDPSLNNPAAALLRMVEKDKITADYLICCGDLTNHANPEGLSAAWDFLQDLRVLLKAKSVISTVGNHDIKSRLKTKASFSHPFDHIKGLSPQFPFTNEAQFDQYWARNFAIHTTKYAHFLVLNTCSCHGYLDEYQHGRVSDWTLKQIDRSLKRAKKRKFNICVCHHHPHKHEELNLDDYDEIKHGQMLLHQLDQHGPWLIVHGHKHHPRLIYSQGSSSSPVVFSAGSFAANFEPESQSKIRNQCYLISLGESMDLHPPAGCYVAWTWSISSGWEFRQDYVQLPAEGGFGCRDRSGVLKKILSVLRKGTTITWDELLHKVPKLRFLVPSDVELLLGELKSAGVKFDRASNFYPREFQR